MDWLVGGWSAGWLVGWRAGQSVNRSVRGLVGWSVSQLVGWSVGGWSFGWWIGRSGGRSVQEGAFDKFDDDDDVAKFMHGMLERKDHAIVVWGCSPKLSSSPTLLVQHYKNTKLADSGILKPFKRQMQYSKSANGTVESLLG